MSRVPRSQEHLKTAFTAEAASAARFRARAEQAERQGLALLAGRWRQLAAAKDELAIRLLDAAGAGADAAAAVRDALAEERYENEVLYPRMIGEVDEETAELLAAVVGVQQGHAAELEELRREVQAARGDLEPATGER